MQAKDLLRVRQNQQRSRERKRSYVAELERKVAILAAQDISCPTVRNENDARRDLLLALGIATSAQELYIQTYTTRLTPRDTGGPGESPSSSDQFDTNFRVAHVSQIHTAYSTELVFDYLYVQLNRSAVASSSSSSGCLPGLPDSSAKPCHQLSLSQRDPPTLLSPSIPSGLLPLSLYSHCNTIEVDRLSAPLLPSVCLSTEIGAAAASPTFVRNISQEAALSLLQTDGVHNSPSVDAALSDFTAVICPSRAVEAPLSPALPESEAAVFSDPRSSGFLDHITILPFDNINTVLHLNGHDSDGTTACPIAFNLILQNNVRGYSITRLESKLLAGYRNNANASESCRILNKVLFAVLAEISQGP